MTPHEWAEQKKRLNVLISQLPAEKLQLFNLFDSTVTDSINKLLAVVDEKDEKFSCMVLMILGCSLIHEAECRMPPPEKTFLWI